MQNNIGTVDSMTFRPNPTLHLCPLVEAARVLFVLFRWLLCFVLVDG